ncbi:MAG: TIGR00730 family Rossman fold protein [Planctomycetia bacterium]|nr:TIGR00730 family Rossman fold protein [Planctomycetia bacterium]
MKRLCVFCGSSRGTTKIYVDAARKLGKTLVKNNIGLVYGGGDVGLMGEIAHTVVDEGGEVIGVIPKALFDKEVAYTTLPDLRVVNSMHERKSLMVELSDGFIAMPGGLGTIEEFFEVLTWTQLGIHEKPCGILNVDGYFDHLIEFLNHTVSQKFVNKVHQSMILIKNDPVELIKSFESYKSPKIDKAKWILSLNNA